MNKYNNNETKITMGSNIIDLYMDGYDEGKNDDIVLKDTKAKNKRQKSTKEKVSARRKKTYYKSKQRQETLLVHHTPSPEREAVIKGMLRDHQLPMSETKCELPCGTSIGNKRRLDTANQKLTEDFVIA